MGTLAWLLPWGSSSDGSSPTVTQSALWANRSVYQQTGNLVRFTDYAGGQGANGGGTFMFYNGTRWKPLNSNVVLDRIDTQNDGTAGGTPFNLNRMLTQSCRGRLPHSMRWSFGNTVQEWRR